MLCVKSNEKSYKLCCICLCRCCFGLETRVIIKRPILAAEETLTDFHQNETKFFFFQNAQHKKPLRFSKPPILKNLLPKFQRLVLGLVVLIDGKGIDVAQPTVQAPS